jgi:glycosyltransferase involved in cell wall biosynthesis
MKILWQAHEGNVSGANLCLLEYLEILKNKGFEQHVIVPASGSMIRGLQKINIPFSVIQSYHWTSVPGDKVPVILKLRKVVRRRISHAQTQKLIRAFKPDVIVTNTIANPTAAYAAKKMSIRHVWFIHEFGKEDHGYIIADDLSKGKKLINELSEKIVFNSKIIQSHYERFIENHKRFIVYNSPNISTLERKRTNADGKLKLIMLGQIAPSKNQLGALKALKICTNEGLALELNIVGTAENVEYLRLLKQYIASEKLENHVNFLGPTDRPETKLIEHDVLLVCSRMEAFGRVTVEAHKCGLPVIAANTGGSVELIIEGENGYLYESGNYADLASKILKFSKKIDVFDSKKISAHAVGKFNTVNTGQQLLEVFN